MKYIHYIVEDFVKDEYFQKWILETDLITSNFWNNWLIEHPEKKDVLQGLRKLKVEDITKTDLTDINKFGCSFGAAAVLLVSFSIIYNFVFLK